MSYATLSSAPVQPQGARLPGGGFVVRPREILERLLRLVDVGRDGRITADDLRRARVKSLTLRLGTGVEVVLSGAERLSGFAALLGHEIRKGNAEHAILPMSAIAPTRLDAVLAYVANSWEGLTRHADDVPSLTRAIDEGMLGRPAGGRYYLYAPQTDEEALRKLTRQARGRKDVEIVPLPRRTPITHRHFDVTAAIKAFPAFACVSLDEGLKRSAQALKAVAR